MSQPPLTQTDVLAALTAARSANYFRDTFNGVQAPVLMAGKGIWPQHMKSSSTAITLTAARYLFVPMWVPADTYAGVKCVNSGTGDNGKKLKIAFYSQATAGGPGALAKSFGEVVLTGASAIRTFASSWTVQTPAMYWLACVSDTAPAFYSMAPTEQMTGVGLAPPDPLIPQIGAFPADYLSFGVSYTYQCDYVAGTYANFPEATALTPTNSATSQTGVVPMMMLYK